MGDLGDYYDCDACGKLDCECFGIKRYEKSSTLAWWRYTAIDNLGTALELAATLAAMHRIGYTKGFEAGRLLAEFCEDYVPEPYFPTADSRPTAERRKWLKS